MRDAQIIRGFKEHDNVINQIHRRLKEMEKSTDKAYMHSLTHVMMWDVLLGLLADKGMITKDQFDLALKDLSAKTQVAMENEAKKKAEEANPKVTVVSDVPAIPVVK